MTMKLKLFDSELKIMEALWQDGSMTAKQLVEKMKETTGWNKNTTYTVIKKCIDKGIIHREEPNFICRAAITREEVQRYETQELIGKMFDGSREKFLAAFFSEKSLSREEIDGLKRLVERLQ